MIVSMSLVVAPRLSVFQVLVGKSSHPLDRPDTPSSVCILSPHLSVQHLERSEIIT